MVPPSPRSCLCSSNLQRETMLTPRIRRTSPVTTLTLRLPGNPPADFALFAQGL